MPWFRRQKNESDVPATQPASVAREAPEPVVSTPAADRAAATTDPNRPKRRRGSRGGRGRKKPGATAAGEAQNGANADGTPVAKSGTPRAKAAPAGPKAEKKPQPERKTLSQRQERRRQDAGRRRQAPRRAPLPAAKRELLVSVDVGEQRVAVVEDG